jgi:hypothetical protein
MYSTKRYKSIATNPRLQRGSGRARLEEDSAGSWNASETGIVL